MRIDNWENGVLLLLGKDLQGERDIYSGGGKRRDMSEQVKKVINYSIPYQ